MSKPSNYYYIQNGNIDAGFMLDASGNPYLLCYLSYMGSDNLLDDGPDLGRSFQADLIDGYLTAGKTDFRYNTVNPTQGGGNYGRIKPAVRMCSYLSKGLRIEMDALDYSPNTADIGAYRSKLIQSRYPKCGWVLIVEYQVESNAVIIKTDFYHADLYAHQVHQFRPAILYLNSKQFQYPLLNESKRNLTSWLGAEIQDERIQVETVDKKIRMTFTAGVEEHLSYLTQRQFDTNNMDVLDETGTADVWEAMVVSQIDGMVLSGRPLQGWGRIDCQPVKLKFDLAQMIKNLFATIKERRQRMKIMCDDGTLPVEDNQFAWLDTTGKLVNMNTPVPAGTGYFAGTMTTLNAVLTTMPAGWTPPVVETPVVPPADDFETEVLESMDKMGDLLVGIFSLLESIEENTRK